MPIRIRELTPAEMPRLLPLIQQLNPAITKARFSRLLKPMLASGYQAIGAFDGTKLVGCSGFWIFARFWCGTQLDIDNFAVDAACQGKGIGKKMVGWLEKKAKKEGCDLMVLDSYVTGHDAHRFYVQQGFVMTGYHFTKQPGSRTPWAKPTR